MPPHLSLWPYADQLHRKWGHKVVKYDGNYHLQKPLIWVRPILGALHSSPHLILTVTYEVGLMLQMNILRQREARQLCRFTQPVSTRTKNGSRQFGPRVCALNHCSVSLTNGLRSWRQQLMKMDSNTARLHVRHQICTFPYISLALDSDQFTALN